MESLVSDFMNHVSRKEAVMAYQVYMELCEVKRYHNISYIYNSTLGRIIFFASKTKNEEVSAFLPIQVQEQLSFLKMRLICQALEYSTIYLVIVHPDSTCVYYQIKEGLTEPTEVSAKHLKENKQEKLDADLRKNRDVLKSAALMNTKITIKKES